MSSTLAPLILCCGVPSQARLHWKADRGNEWSWRRLRPDALGMCPPSSSSLVSFVAFAQTWQLPLCVTNGRRPDFVPSRWLTGHHSVLASITASEPYNDSQRQGSAWHDRAEVAPDVCSTCASRPLRRGHTHSAQRATRVKETHVVHSDYDP